MLSGAVSERFQNWPVLRAIAEFYPPPGGGLARKAVQEMTHTLSPNSAAQKKFL